MGLACRITYDKGIAEVTDEFGSPSRLYDEILTIVNDQETALNVWATAYEEDFGNKGEEASVTELVKFFDSKVASEQNLSPAEKIQVKDFMHRNNIETLNDLQIELAKIFKPNGIFNIDVEQGVASGLYSQEEIKNLDAEAVQDILHKIEGHIVIEDFVVAPQTEKYKHKNANRLTILGTYERVLNKEIDDAIVEKVENFNDVDSFYAGVRELPYTDFVNEFLENDEFAKEIMSKFKGLKKVKRVAIVGGKLSDGNNHLYTTLKNTMMVSTNNLKVEADIEYLNSIDNETWESEQETIKIILKEIEESLVGLNIDIIGMSKNSASREEVMALLGATSRLLDNANESTVQDFVSVHKVTIESKEPIRTEVFPEKYVDYNIVSLHSNLTEGELFNQFGFIKIGENLYHNVDKDANIDDITDYIYRGVKEGVIDIEVIDIENKVESLKEISAFLMSRKTDSQFANHELYSAYQVAFRHTPLTQHTEHVGNLPLITTSESYLKTNFISDFYNYILREKLKGSEVYKGILANFEINDRDISLISPISSLEGIEFKKELEDYISLKKDNNMKHLVEDSAKVSEDMLNLNFPQNKNEYEGTTIKSGDYLILPRTADRYIKLNGELYRKEMSKMHSDLFIKINTPQDTIYYTANTDFSFDREEAGRVFDKYGNLTPSQVSHIDFQETIAKSRIEDNMLTDLKNLSTLKDNSYTFFESDGFIIAVKDGVKVGSIKVNKVGNKYLMEDITVSESHRGIGVGTELYLNLFDKIAKDNSVFIPSKNETKQTKNIYSRMEDLLIPIREGFRIGKGKISLFNSTNITTINSNIEGGILNQQQIEDLQKEIESKYNRDSRDIFNKDFDDIRQNLFNYENPFMEKVVNDVELRVAEGLIRNKRKTYLLYADGKIVGEFYSIDDIKSVVKVIEDSLVKNVGKGTDNVFRGENLAPNGKVSNLTDVSQRFPGINLDEGIFTRPMINSLLTSLRSRGETYSVEVFETIRDKSDTGNLEYELSEVVEEIQDRDLKLKDVVGIIRATTDLDLESFSTQDILKYLTSIGDPSIGRIANSIYRGGNIKSAVNNTGEFSSASENINFQQQTTQSSTPIEVFNGLVSKLESTGISMGKVIVDKTQMRTILTTEVDANKVNGFERNGTVYINPDAIGSNVVLHEFGHLWHRWATKNAPHLVKTGKKLVEGSIYHELVKEASKNPESVYYNNTPEQILEEALVMAIGDKGELIVNKAKKSKFNEWLTNLWTTIKNSLGLSKMTADEVSNLTLGEFAEAVAIDLLGGKEAFDGTNSFERWKGDNRLVSGESIQNIKTGEPVVIEGYHGTTHEFYEFNSSERGNIEGHLGKVNYFTSEYSDASENYQVEGKDLEGRVDQRAEKISQIIEEEYTDLEGELQIIAITKDFNITTEEINLEGKDIESIGKVIAKKELIGRDEKVLELYIKLNNPVVLGLEKKWVEIIPESLYENSLEDAVKEVAEQNDVTIEEAKEEYNWEVREKAMEMEGVENPFIEALQDAIDSNSDYSSTTANEILADLIYEEEVDLNQLEKDVREGVAYEEGEEGTVSSQIVADMFKNLGYDGIILTDVSQRFPGMNLYEGVSHIHVFDKFSNQIKSMEGDNVTFTDSSKDIRYQVIGEKGIRKLDTISPSINRAMNLGVAKDMTDKGEDVLTVRLATGWEKGADGKWKYEIDDSSLEMKEIDIEVKEDKNFGGQTARMMISDILDYPTLFEIYPQLKDIKVVFFKDESGSLDNNLMTVYNKTLYINLKEYGKEIDKGYYKIRSSNEIRSTTLHEIQHFIQEIEGFGAGASQEGIKKGIERVLSLTRLGNKEGIEQDEYLRNIQRIILERKEVILLQDKNHPMYNEALELISKDIYWTAHGEVESRNIEKRKGFTPIQRAVGTLESTESVSRLKQVDVYAAEAQNSENISSIFDSKLTLLDLYTSKEEVGIREKIDSCGK